MIFIKKRFQNISLLLFFIVIFGINAIAQVADNQEKYNQAINQAEKLFFEKKYKESKIAFQNAQKLMPSETHPKTRIEEINKILGIVDPVDGQFNQVVTKADALYNAKKYQEALDAYKAANDILPGQQHTTDRIFELHALIKKNENIERNFQNALTKGNQYFTDKKYDLAITEFETALSLKPGDTGASSKISEINKILSKKADYQKAVEIADDFYASKEYEKARAAYLQAQSIIPEDKYPQNMISRIDELNAQLAGEEQARQQQYNQAIADGDAYFSKQEFTQARAKYESAIKIKPAESYPKVKISEIENTIANLELKEQQYAQYISEGDKLIGEQKVSEALAAFKGAEFLKPEEVYPKTKIAEIATLLAGIQQTEQRYQTAISKGDQEFGAKNYEAAKSEYQAASNLKPDESYPKTKIAEITALLNGIQQTEQSYQAAISKGDQEFGAKNYEAAKSEYQAASNLKPDESYPKTKIAEIATLLAGIQQTEQSYQAAISKGDQEFGAKNYEAAKSVYQAASNLKPDESYPKTKIAEITTLLTGIQQTEQSYQAAISKGDQEFAAKNYEAAKSEYQAASNLKPEESYPKTKIVEIEHLLEMAAIDLAEKHKNYDALIASGNFQYDAANYQMARVSYNEALKLFPDELFPQERMKDIDAKLKAEMERIQNEYDKAITEADRLFSGKIYDNAIQFYTQASGIKPDEKYPLDQIKAITKLIQENVVVHLISQSTPIESGALKQFGFEPVLRQGRKESYVVMKVMNLGDQDVRLFLNYGKDSVKNGGFVIIISKSDTPLDYIINVGSQYKWVSENNNWLSLQPEGGNTEFLQFQISQE